jgi:hypothetical protein
MSFGFGRPPEGLATLWEKLPEESGKISVWDGSLDESFEGTGWPDDPYLIKTAAQLACFAKMVNGGNIIKFGDPSVASVAFVRLLTDIDLNNIEWEPIGYGPWSSRKREGTAFGGVFEGNGHVIKNLKITENNSDNVGFFSRTLDAYISNLRIENATIVGGGNVGILTGSHWGVINNCHVEGTIIGDWAVGGLVGYSYLSSKIREEYAETIIKHSSAYAVIDCPKYAKTGGFVGHTSWLTNFLNCFSSSDITGVEGVGGGFVGLTQDGSSHNTSVAEFSSCASAGKVNGKWHSLGGFVGELGYWTLIENSLSMTDVSGDKISGGFAGVNHGLIENSKAYGVVAVSETSGGFIGANVTAYGQGHSTLHDMIFAGRREILEKRMGKAKSCEWLRNDEVNYALNAIGAGSDETIEGNITTFIENDAIKARDAIVKKIGERQGFRAANTIYAEKNETRRLILDIGSEKKFSITIISPDKINDSVLTHSGGVIEITTGNEAIAGGIISIDYTLEDDREAISSKIFGLFVKD